LAATIGIAVLWIRILMRFRIRRITLMRIRIMIFLFVSDPDADMDPTFYPVADPNPDPSFKKGSNP
jgi:hypothetical protein